MTGQISEVGQTPVTLTLRTFSDVWKKYSGSV